MKGKVLVKGLVLLVCLLMLSASSVMAEGEEPCYGNFDCNQSVDAADVTLFLSSFGRSPFFNPCPICQDSPCPCTPCPYGMVDCGDKCVDPETDREYCGVNEECIGGSACGDGEICVGGVCALTCQLELVNCGGVCVDTNTDESNCGTCGEICSSGEICVMGNCETDYPVFSYQTGQSTSYATGDDGDLQRGVVWPNPRFTDNGDNTVTDNLTSLVWLKDANCFGTRTWANAISDANGLANGSCGLTDSSIAGDWRLPNLRELQSIIDYGQLDPALTAGHPFENVLFVTYWSSTTSGGIIVYAWTVQIRNGIVDRYLKTDNNYVWPVRGGQ